MINEFHLQTWRNRKPPTLSEHRFAVGQFVRMRNDSPNGEVEINILRCSACLRYCGWQRSLNVAGGKTGKYEYDT